ncbi:MAG: sugar-transporting ATPase [Planctomycetaceae bacterium]|nr:sugar-transporting ATPase [Planctomycetaceae bacterium]
MSKLRDNVVFRFLNNNGMLLVLFALCGYYSVVTYSEQFPTGRDAAERLADRIAAQFGDDAKVLVVTRANAADVEFADVVANRLKQSGVDVIETVNGEPVDARKVLVRLNKKQTPVAAIACTKMTASWLIFDDLPTDFPELGEAQILQPESYYWPTFLKGDNLLNVANQIAVTAIIAIGMTMVIVTAGIDLSVGSLVALSAVIATLVIRDWFGGTEAGAGGLIAGCLIALVISTLIGLFTGVMVTGFSIPPFIVTLAMMLVARGIAYILAEGQSVYEVPDEFTWLGRHQWELGEIALPVAVLLMLILYSMAHIVMSYTSLGRYIYAVGGNPETARLSGVPVPLILLFAYTASGFFSGLGGIVTASTLKSGSPTYGFMYELYVIAAVVVGGTSLSGGEGKISGTLIGAFIIAVIRNGMNLTNVESYTQNVVLGLIILAAAMLDMIKRKGMTLPAFTFIKKLLR